MSQRTATMHIWLSKYHDIRHLANASAVELASSISLTSTGPDEDSYQKREGYTYLGTAAVTMDLMDKDAIVSSKVEALRQEQKATRAAAEKKNTDLEQQIQKLLAIGWDGIADPAEEEIPF